MVPKSCSLFMTDRCNLQCAGCRRNTIGFSEFKEMELGTVEKLLSLYPSIKSFSVSGFGEPTLCRKFVDIVDFLLINKKKVTVITNGTYLDRFLKLKLKPNNISISLYGYDKVSYLNYTGVDAYDEVINNFFKLKESFNRVGFSYILTRENYRELDNLLILCDKIHPDFLHLINYIAYDSTDVNEIEKIIRVQNSEIIAYIDKFCSNRDYIELKPVYIDVENPTYKCRSYDTIINLDGNGNIGGCLRQIPPSKLFGNIFTDRDPFNSKEMSKLRKLQHTMSRTKITPHKECSYCFGNWC